MTGFDIIGDVHGSANELRELLGRLGYDRDKAGVYRHPDRTAVFIGDLVDRGEDQLDVLQIVKGMHDAGSAQMVMGNHEFNAICYTIPHPEKPGKFLRDNDENEKSHAAFLAVPEEERRHYLDWFRTLPLWLDVQADNGNTLRLIHACWHPESMRVVEEHCDGSNKLTSDDHYVMARDKQHPLYHAVEKLLKGPEISLGPHAPYYDHDGKPRDSARARWWKRGARTLHDLADIRGMKTKGGLKYGPLPHDEVDDFDFALVYSDSVPVIFGHYWFDWKDHLDHWTEYTACVDFGACDGGKLVAYRWSGEQTISPENYVPHEAVAATSSG